MTDIASTQPASTTPGTTPGTDGTADDTADDTSSSGSAQAAASTAADEGKHVAGVAQGEAGKVATEAKDQVRSLVGESRDQVATQLDDQTRQQRDKLVGTLGTLGDDLDRMADQSDAGLASDVVREVAGHARSLTSHLDGREPAQLLDDVRDFARRRPGLFLLGALAAGVVVGRVVRGVKDSDDVTTGTSDLSSPGRAAPETASSPTHPAAITPDPYAPVDVPPMPPPAAAPFADEPVPGSGR
ncbi:hypothetical protein GCM10023340_33200 [Nocardioides marinquilinus]|uniref:DUF3618 domain-containing protein n=1 Tax=Nocardioides marinquilinus TaxID=1210400 RepID=A0ABP9PUZ8_9ACTN